MTDGNEKALKGEQTLAQILEFLAQLENKPDVKNKVIEDIKEKVKEYVKDDGKFSSSSSGYIAETIKKCQKLRSDIVKQENTYRHYSDLKDGNANKYSQLLINNIFFFFGCLYYMYFECAGDCYGINGGRWYDNKCDGSGGGRARDNLMKWLTDQKRVPGRMIKRDFKQDKLSQNEGKDLFGNIGHGSNLLSYTQGAELQWALYFMLFLPGEDSWNRAQSGHAVLFLQAFCEEITEYQFDDDHTAAEGSGDEKFKNACEKVQGSILSLMGSNTIVPVASSNTVNYKDLMDEKHFSKYIGWLRDNHEKLIKSLKEMKDDVSKWNENDLRDSKTFGPYPWGFTFEYNWESNKAQLNEPLQELTEALESFKNALPSTWKGKRRSKRAHENSSNPTDSTASTASTVGGVAAGLGAAAGAAYAGSGILGPVAESIGKFVRGLFF